jgi:hypothetical protein
MLFQKEAILQASLQEVGVEGLQQMLKPEAPWEQVALVEVEDLEEVIRLLGLSLNAFAIRCWSHRYRCHLN